MKKFKSLLIATLLILCVNLCVSAEESVIFSLENNRFDVTGTTTPGSRIMLTVYHPTAQTDSKDGVIYAKTTEAYTSDYSFSVPFSTRTAENHVTGDYRFRVTANGAANTTETAYCALPGFEIHGFELGEDNKSASVVVNSVDGTNDVEAILFVALYSTDGRMVAVSKADWTENGTMTATISDTELPEDFATNGSAYKAKAFLWNSMASLKPLAESK